jgi:hypothetical protein
MTWHVAVCGGSAAKVKKASAPAACGRERERDELTHGAV